MTGIPHREAGVHLIPWWDGQQCLVNLTTGEMAAVPASACLAFDPLGWAFLVEEYQLQDPDEQQTWCKTVFKTVALKHDARSIYIHSKADGSTAWLDQLLHGHAMHYPTITVGTSIKTIVAGQLHVCRDAQWIYWVLWPIQDRIGDT